MRRLHEGTWSLSGFKHTVRSGEIRVLLTVRLWWRSFAKFGHQAHVFFVDLGLVVACWWPALSRTFASAILSDVTCSTARRTHNARCNIWLVWAKPGLVFIGTTIRTTRTIGFTQSSVQLSQFPKLHPAKIVMSLRNLDTLANDVLDAIHSLLDCFRIAGRDKCMKWFVLSREWLTVFASHFAFLHGSLASDDDLGTCVLFHSFQGVTTRPNQQTDKVDVRMLFLRDEHLVADTNNRWPVANRKKKHSKR